MTRALTKEERHVMEHALGRTYPDKPRDYRNHYCIGPDGDTYPVWLGLVDRGLARRGGAPSWLGGMVTFHVTADGKNALDERPPQPCFLCRILSGHEGACKEVRRDR